MSQLDLTSDTSQGDPGARKDSYLQWRRRLADQQEDLRNYGGHDPEPTVSPEWSPEALFTTGGASTTTMEAAPVDLTVVERAESTPAEPEPFRPIADGAPDPGSDAAWDRSEVDALLRQFRATVGSPRAASRATREGSGSGLVHGRDAHVVRYFDGSRVVRTSTPEQARDDASVGEQLRELNRLRLEDELDEDEFNRRKRALFTRGSAALRSSIEPR